MGAAPELAPMMAAVATALAGPLAPLYRAYFATLRVSGLFNDGRMVDPRDYAFGREIFALSERDALVLAGVSAYAPFTILVALGRDGDWATALLARLGFRVVRGSSLRGGRQAASDLERVLRGTEDPAAIVVDGPLGPAGQAKPGTVVLGLRTRRPVRALGVAARRRIVFRTTWSGIFLPLPFTRVIIACDDPLPMPVGLDRGGVAARTAELSARLALMRRRAEGAVGRGDGVGLAVTATDGPGAAGRQEAT